MAKLTKDQITQVASLAKLELSDVQLQEATEQVSSILGFVEKLQKLDTNGVDPVSQVTGLSDVWREDKVIDCGIPQKQLLQNAPSTQDGYVKVKRVLR